MTDIRCGKANCNRQGKVEARLKDMNTWLCGHHTKLTRADKQAGWRLLTVRPDQLASQGQVSSESRYSC